MFLKQRFAWFKVCRGWRTSPFKRVALALVGEKASPPFCEVFRGKARVLGRGGLTIKLMKQ